MQGPLIQQKINALIESNQANNNFLALSLMQTQLKLDFGTAFRSLIFNQIEDQLISTSDIYQVNILDFTIQFEIKHCWATIKEYPFLEITRLVFQQKKRIPELRRCFTIDFFESETERDMFEAMQDIPELGNDIAPYLF